MGPPKNKHNAVLTTKSGLQPSGRRILHILPFLLLNERSDSSKLVTSKGKKKGRLLFGNFQVTSASSSSLELNSRALAIFLRSTCVREQDRTAFFPLHWQREGETPQIIKPQLIMWTLEVGPRGVIIGGGGGIQSQNVGLFGLVALTSTKMCVFLCAHVACYSPLAPKVLRSAVSASLFFISEHRG